VGLKKADCDGGGGGGGAGPREEGPEGGGGGADDVQGSLRIQHVDADTDDECNDSKGSEDEDECEENVAGLEGDAAPLGGVEVGEGGGGFSRA